MAQDPQKEIEFFNRFAQDKDYDSLTDYGYKSIIKAFKRHAGARLDSVQTGVDLGCGTGSFTRRFFTPAIKAFGVDISIQAVERAQSKKDEIVYFVSDISALGIKSNSVDLVVFSGVLHHFPDPAPVLKEAYRILRKGGLLLSYDPHIKHPGMWLYRHPSSPFFSKIGKTDNEILLSKEGMQSRLKETGFTGVQTTAISGVGISYLESPLARLFLPFYNCLEFILGLLPVADDIGSFLICSAEK